MGSLPVLTTDDATSWHRAELAASRAHGAMASHQCLTQCLLPFLFSLLLISVLDLHSHQRTEPRVAEVTAKLLELSIFKSHFWYSLVRFPSGLFPTEIYSVRVRALEDPKGLTHPFCLFADGATSFSTPFSF